MQVNNQSSIKTIIKRLQYLFLNKQLDEFVEIIQRQILPYVNGPKHHQKQIKKQARQIQKQARNVKKQEIINKKQINQSKDIQQHIQYNKQQQVRGQTLKQQSKIKQNQLSQQNQLILLKQKQITQAVSSSHLNLLQKYQDIKLVLSKLQHLSLKLQQKISQQNEWKINKLNNKSKIAVKTIGTKVEIKFQGLLQASIENLIIMIYLIELYKECVPFCSGSKNCYQPSPLEKIALLDFKFPFMTQRFAYFHGMAVDRITKNGKLYIYAQGITKQHEMLTKIYKIGEQDYNKKMAKSVPLDVKHAICEISDAGNGEYLFRAYTYVDTNMPSLPQMAVNYIVKSMGGWIFDKILKKANNFKNSPWEKQMIENQKRQKKDMFYKWLKQRIGNWGKSKNNQKQQKKRDKFAHSKSKI